MIASQDSHSAEIDYAPQGCLLCIFLDSENSFWYYKFILCSFVYTFYTFLNALWYVSKDSKRKIQTKHIDLLQLTIQVLSRISVVCYTGLSYTIDVSTAWSFWKARQPSWIAFFFFPPLITWVKSSLLHAKILLKRFKGWSIITEAV